MRPGLVPGRYYLVVDTGGSSTSVKFTAKENEIRGLSLLDLTKEVVRDYAN